MVRVGVVCACLSTLPPLFRRVRRHLPHPSGSSGSSEISPSSVERNGEIVVVVDVGISDASPNGEGKRGKQQGWCSQMLNSYSNKSTEGQTESREEIVEVYKRKFSDDSVWGR